MRLCVTGGRDYPNWQLVSSWLDTFHDRYGVEVVIHGGNKGGADLAADTWAWRNNMAVDRYPVSKEDWEEHGKAAGPMRNEEMARVGRPDVVLGFPGGAGTRSMLRAAYFAIIPTLMVGDPGHRYQFRDVYADHDLPRTPEAGESVWLVPIPEDRKLARRKSKADMDRYLADALF